jgi:hypothetical protein
MSGNGLDILCHKLNVILTEQCNVMVNSDELIGTVENLMQDTKWRMNLCCYNWI